MKGLVIRMEEKKDWKPREGYSLTLEEINFLFREYLNNYAGCNQLEEKRIVREIEKLRSWLSNAAFYGTRL